jgi:molybdopterin converting factor subunit 1
VQVKVCLFARAREAYGRAEATVDLPSDATPAECFTLLVERSPALARLRPSLLVAINEEYAGWDGALTDGDELAFIPPVSGG